MSQRVTLADLSKKTGLSQTTISMILSRRPNVSFAEETIRLVKNAARELGYSTGSRKRMALFTRRSIMVICPFLLNHYYSAVVQALQSAASEMQCHILVHATYNNPDEEAKILKTMGDADIGGIIFAMLPQSRSLVSKLSKTVPIIIIADRENGFNTDFIELHNYKAGCLVAQHLAELGHNNLICISTTLSSSIPARSMRFAGLKESWTKLKPYGKLRLFTNYVTPAMSRDNLQMERLLGEEITYTALEQTGSDFTAIVAINDMLAYGSLDALNRVHKKVPDDVSVCGCDNDYPSSIRGVNLTSVEHFMAQNAKQAFRILYQKMMEEEFPGHFPVLKNIQPELIIRSSTAPAQN